ncbi:MAG: NAD(P)H-dependent glycerol-3-phosphate dehydrogenase [Rubinisphaera brasiliensis]|uniref:Glycerol-3-phosphate dehydrogenase [NAD(P)+] n=1 Tax=Rubinisphaera brasiliensis (strain ATCC 49424 / DSM 5305 / JCM 21570 / IAM 15109 / NBRC 103401 / IFAM 1448) TaxID=756272 RepID=F0SF60_RUBBR|nr:MULTISPECIES: NAD(P)H-dependent glycerol-3-phosphate dehydrogenase [Rubinisphaera]ADY58215.1 glycerol 3-phosphate dehydrogenase (NAD(P)+) [Rubinisphaera brasiliensis DSM 5305]MBR9804818.1 NAD(P)-dependent glycerol-3-phosphate dehydrogenase [bacterium]
MPTKIAVLGGGAMGTACALLLNEHADQQVSIWLRNADFAADMATSRENKRLLPGVHIPEEIDITADIQQAIDGAEFLVAAVPSAYLRQSLEQVAPALSGMRPVISVVKGLEPETHLRPSEIINDVLGTRTVVAVGGPSHAEEIARRLPATVVAACGNLSMAKQVQSMFGTERFRVYANLDIIGVEIAGAVKNVIAIAAGICDGLGFGDNAKSALMTRGQVEMTRFGRFFGAEESTFAGLAGIGDLITTCISPYGRNRLVGERLGQGQSLKEILDSMDAVAEGVKTTQAVIELADQNDIEMPIAQEVYRVLFEDKSPLEATDTLMSRPFKTE